jgi:hypothetical protein
MTHMKNRGFLLLATSLPLFIILTACTTQLDAQATVLRAPAARPASANAEPQPTITASEAADPNYCLDCHADQQQLIDTAKPEEPAAEGESKGVG